MEKKTHLTGYIVLFLICAALLIASGIYYSRSLYTRTEDEVAAVMLDGAVKTSNMINNQYAEGLGLLNGLAQMLSLDGIRHGDGAILERLANTEQYSSFAYLGLAYADGMLYHGNTAPMDVSGEDWYRTAMSGEVAYSTLEGTYFAIAGIGMVIAVPIHQGDEVPGAVVGVMRADDLSEILAMDHLGDAERLRYIVEPSGRVVASSTEPKPGTVYEVAAAFDDFPPEDVDGILAAMTGQETSFAHYHKGGQVYHVLYTPVEWQDWYFIIAIPDTTVTDMTRESALGTSFLTIMTGLVVILCFSALLHLNRRNYKALHAAYDEIDSVYQAVPIAVLQFYMDDHLTIKRANDAFYRLVGCSQEEYRERYGNRLAPLMATPDVTATMAYKTGILRRELGLKCADGTEKWVYGALTMIRDGTPPLLQCSLTNITEQKQQLRIYETYANVDSLTMLKNRFAAKTEIGKLVERGPQDRGALFMFDLDNFKQVNDTLGHPEGDHLLTAFADILRKSFTETDVIGRLGGDEFVAFLPDCRTKQEAAALLDALLERMRTELDSCFLNLGVSASIGAVMVSGPDETVERLYKRADMALYAAKRDGKGRYAFYHSLEIE